MKRIDLTWKKFNRLFVKAFPHKASNGQSHWLCECQCGNLVTVEGSELKSGATKSCGCFRKERLLVHGHNRIANSARPTRTHNSWRGMLERCNDPNNVNYVRYGALGISVCERWRKFENFLADMGERPEGKTIDRINPFGNYEPCNCRWATYKEQRANRRANYEPCS